MNNKKLKDFFSKRWLILAPMAGVNDPIFRQICIENGAQLTYTEMVSSKALSYNNSKTKNLLTLAKNEDKVVVQLFGHDPKTMAQEAHNIELQLKDRLAYIDINMGCPARKITKKGDGAALMKTPSLACEIVSECNKACKSAITVKFRLGYNTGENNYFDFAKRIEQAGASAIAIHGRYATQFYKGESNIDEVEMVAKNVDVPVVYSGDVCNVKQAKEIIDGSSISAVMIGRASRGNP